MVLLFVPSTHKNVPVINYYRRDVDRLNNQKLAELPGTAKVFIAIDSGEDVYVRMLQSHCPARQRLELKLGSQVILVKSTAALEGLVNGARGMITNFVKYVYY